LASTAKRPTGQTVTYGQIAKGLPLCATAQDVGAACAANVLTVAIPVTAWSRPTVRSRAIAGSCNARGRSRAVRLRHVEILYPSNGISDADEPKDDDYLRELAFNGSVYLGTVGAPRRRATATPNRNATNSEPRGASRAMLLKMLNGIPGFRPASIASPTRWTVPFTASETSAMVDFGSGTGSKPSWANGASGMSSLTI